MLNLFEKLYIPQDSSLDHSLGTLTHSCNLIVQVRLIILYFIIRLVNYAFLRYFIDQIKLVVLSSRFKLITFVHFEEYRLSNLLEKLYLPQVSTRFEADKPTFNHSQNLHLKPH